MGDVVELKMITKLDIPVERVVQNALNKDLVDVVIIGVNKEGGEFFASSVADGGYVLWMIERAKLKLLQVPDRDDIWGPPDASA